MKYLLFFFTIVIFSLTSSAQTTQNSELYALPSQNIQVTDKATIIILFPYTVRDADCGNENIGAEKVPEKPNVIKVKAVKQFNDTTSLHVFTGDGSIYTFKVSWSSTLPTLTYDQREQTTQTNNFNIVNEATPLNEQELKSDLGKIKVAKKFLHISNRKYKIRLSLQGTYVHKNTIFLKFRVTNRSRLPYQSGWTNLYIQDKKVARRSSVQQIPIQPVYTDAPPLITGRSGKEWIIAIPQTTIPDKKKLTLELQEQNGGRHISFTIHNKSLFKAKSL